MVAERPRRHKSLPVYPVRSEVHRILAACTCERDRHLIKLLWWTGGRVSEVIQIRAGDITTHGLRMPNLKQHVPAEKHVYLPPACLAEIRSWAAGRQPQDVLVGRLTDGRPISRKTAWSIVTRASARAGVLKPRRRDAPLRPLWCHSFRHGNAIHQLEEGMPVHAVQAQLGHSTLSSTSVYLQIADSYREERAALIQY